MIGEKEGRAQSLTDTKTMPLSSPLESSKCSQCVIGIDVPFTVWPHLEEPKYIGVIGNFCHSEDVL